MPKSEDEIFSNMKNSVLLIIIFTNFIACIDLNITDDEYPTCPITLFRRKREQSEYTRWRANLESSQEFIVKVLDEDLTTPNTKKVIAVNIQPLIKGGEKIIIGGVMVPKPTTNVVPTSEVVKDYTRFVPPTTVVTRVDGEIYLAPIQKPDKIKVIPLPQSAVKHPQRDESPPAAPQFLPRTAAASWQYAPITPVGFTRRILSPVTPSLDPISPKPTRTSPFKDLQIPTRTKSEYDEFRRYQNFEEGTDPFASQNKFHRISTMYDTTPTKEFGLLLTDRKRMNQDDRELIEDKKSEHSDAQDEISFHSDTEEKKPDHRDAEGKLPDHSKAGEKSPDHSNTEDKKGDHNDPEATYHMMFYNDDDENTKKAGRLDESYDDRKDIIEIESDFQDSAPGGRKQMQSSPKSVGDYDAVQNSEKTTNISSTEDLKAETTIHEGSRDKRRPICSMLKLRQLNFNSPRTLPEIVAQMTQWAEESPVAKWIDITDGNLTAMENPIYMMIVDDPSSGQIVSAKQTVMIVAGIQGRDHHAVSAAMYVLYQLIERSEAHADLLTKYRFWIIPVFNPDGYDYSMTFPHRREWTKNLRQSWNDCKGRASCFSCEAYGLRCTIQPCYGVNLDRNFEYQWIPAEELRSEHPCGSLYAGTRQLSEAETLALTSFLHEQRTPIYTFIAFKEGEVLGIMYPYSHTKKRRAFDHVYRQRASRAAAAAYSISGRPYVAGQTSEFLPLYAGGIEDWVDSHLGIDNTYTIVMFRPADTYNSKLVTERVVHEAYAAMDTLVLQSMEVFGPPPVTITRARSASQPTRPSKAVLIYSTVFLAFILAFFI